MKLTITKSKFKLLTENKKCRENIEIEVPLQIKTTYPMRQEQIIVPDDAYAGLKKVTVEAIPDSFIIPAGQKEITRNGTHDVHDYAYAIVNVAGTTEQGYTVTISQLVGLSTYRYSVVDYGGQYSIDGGNTWNNFSSIPLTLNNVKSIIFQAFRGVTQYNTIYVTHPTNYSAGNQSVCFIQDNGAWTLNPVEIKITKDTNFYIGCTTKQTGGGAN